MSERVWTAEMIDELKRLRRLGRTFGQIARRLGVTRNAAIGKAMRVGLRVRVRAGPRERAKAPLPEPVALGPTREVLRRGLCHWMHGDPRGAWRMCGHRSVRGRSWCAHHLARVFECTALAASASEVA